MVETTEPVARTAVGLQPRRLAAVEGTVEATGVEVQRRSRFLPVPAVAAPEEEGDTLEVMEVEGQPRSHFLDALALAAVVHAAPARRRLPVLVVMVAAGARQAAGR